MSEIASPGAAAFPVLVACGACGNVHDVILVLSTSFGLAGLLAFGQYLLDRVRKSLGYRRLNPDIVEAALCPLEVRVEPDDRESASQTTARGAPHPR